MLWNWNQKIAAVSNTKTALPATRFTRLVVSVPVVSGIRSRLRGEAAVGSSVEAPACPTSER